MQHGILGKRGMLEELNTHYQDFSDWFAALVELVAINESREVARLVRNSPNSYIGYYYSGYGPGYAYRKEWR